MSDYSLRAERGAKLLDSAIPAWWRMIDAGLLDIEDFKNCIIGQVFGDWSGGTAELDRATDVPLYCDRENQEYYGFELRDEEYRSDLAFHKASLEARWLIEIANRVGASV